MLKKSLFIVLTLFIIGCNEKPYKERDKPESMEYSFSGITEVGTPISSATVSAYEFKELRQGKKIADTISNADGSFNLKLKTDYDGPVLLTANGGLYRDLVRNETIALKPSQELKSVITHIKMPEKTNINAWTTLALARVQADRGFWDKSVAELKDIDRINVDFSHVSYFLSGKTPNYVNISRQEAFDIGKDGFKLEDPRVTLHLAHGGLSKLASDYSVRLSEDGVIIGVMDLVAALADDLSDRVFDGRNAAGNVVYVGNNRRVNLDSYTMRKRLSEAIVLYVDSLATAGKVTAEDKNSLEKPGKLVHAITWQTQPELFPQAEAPKPLDKEPPIVHVSFAGAHSHEQPFAYLDGDVIFAVEAEDDSFVAEIKMLEPKDNQNIGNKFGPIPPEQMPQARIAAQVCGKEAMLDEEIKRLQLNEVNVVCSCFEAKDLMGNAKKELSCFQRSELKATIEFPKVNTVLGARSLNEGVKVEATITGGLPIAECFWRIKPDLSDKIDEGILPGGSGSIDGTNCVIKSVLDGSKFFNGTYYLELTAKDINKRNLEDKSQDDRQSRVYFQVAKDPPAVEIVKPMPNGYIDTSFIEVIGKIQNPQAVESIEYKIRGIDEKNEGSKISSRAVVDKDTGKWDGTSGQNMKAGRYSLELLVTDIYGNKKSLEPHFFVVDIEAPGIMGPAEGVPQKPYLQETLNYHQRFVDDVEKPRYVVEPAGEALPISWSKTPTIQRWSTRLDDARTSPVYTVRASDDNKIKELRYSLGAKCASLRESHRVAELQNDRYEIILTQSMADVDLSRSSQNSKYCLSIWAVDQAGHATNHTSEFFWKVLTPPMSIDMNSHRYKAHRSDDDITSINRTTSMVILEGNPLRVGGNVVVGHAIIANPHSVAMSSALLFQKPMYVKINANYYIIPQNMMKIKYFEYDLAKDRVGREITRMDGSIVLKSDNVALAKFILLQDFAFSYAARDATFWRDFRMEVGFTKSVMDKSAVDGLLLAMRDVSTGKALSEFIVPWGDNHYLRKRTASRFGV